MDNSSSAVLDFTAARDSAIECVKRAADLHYFCTLSWALHEPPGLKSLDEFQAEAAAAFGELARVHSRAYAALPAELLDAVLAASTTAATGPPEIIKLDRQLTGRENSVLACNTWTEFAMAMVQELLTILVCAGAAYEIPYTSNNPRITQLLVDEVMPLGDPETGDRLERVLRGLARDACGAFWRTVCERVVAYPLGNDVLHITKIKAATG